VSLGVDVNVRAAKGATPLHFAAHNGNVQLVRDLVALGADPNQREHQAGGTPLHWAALGGHTDAMHIMVQVRASPKILPWRFLFATAAAAIFVCTLCHGTRLMMMSVAVG
jgi:ankyrin repeat protein